MKLATVAIHGQAHAAVHCAGDGLLDLVRLRERVPEAHLVPTSVKGILQAGEPGLALVRRLLDEVEAGRHGAIAQLTEQGLVLPQAAAQLLPPIPDPGLILSCGAAYREHLREMKVERQQDDEPTAFIKAASALTGSGSPIVLPRKAPAMVDWEGEFSCVIGRSCHGVTEAEALDFVAGYTLVNDVSARDWVPGFLQVQGNALDMLRRTGLNILGKQFPSFCPMGPCIVTKDELPDPGNLQLSTRVNGELMQHAHTSDLIFSVAQVIAYFSQWYRFSPGDVITTGSPAGVGYGRNPKLFLKPGDVVEVSVPQLGTLRNPVVAS
ncbi:fumarylacetoacetate hydrolase family protein [Piscinibacter sp.]|uniref:fumarylacetoacetate hydrolase family protein n=1 Tax=Piscinibacter sp. TaxID=1903157 RepID=UPI0039E5B8BC